MSRLRLQRIPGPLVGCLWAVVLGLCAGESAAGPRTSGRTGDAKQPSAPKTAAKPAVPGGAADDEKARLYRPTRPMFRWEFPPILSEVDVPGEFETNGIPSRFRALVVRMPFGETYRFFNASFVRQGLYVAPERQQLEMGDEQMSLTGYDAERQISYTVILTYHDDRTTGVIMGEAYFKGRAFTAQNPFLPVMAGAEGLVVQRLETGRTLSFKINASAAEVTTFYEQIFKDRGYKKEADGTWSGPGSALHMVVEPEAIPSQAVRVAISELLGAESP